MSEKDISYTTTKSDMAKFELGVRDLVCVYTVAPHKVQVRQPTVYKVQVRQHTVRGWHRTSSAQVGQRCVYGVCGQER